MDDRENRLRAARFERPERIPLSFHVSAACWDHYPQDALQELMAEHPLLLPGFERSAEPIRPDYAPWRRAGVPYTDSWGCVWQTAMNGITGTTVEHPLADWSALDAYTPPSPEEQDGWGRIDWRRIRRRIAAARERGHLAAGWLRHGHTFMTLTYIRGYENLIFDMADDAPQLSGLIGMVEQFNLGLVRRYIAAGAEWLGYPEDLGMQRGPMLSPEQFRRYIRPTYERLVAPAREAGCVVHMHSDGDIRELAGDLIEVGMDVINLQDLVNGIDWIRENLKGRVCVELDIDRQSVTRFGSPAEVDRHIREAVRQLAAPDGGLMLLYGLYPGVPLANVRAVMDAMEKHSHLS